MKPMIAARSLIPLLCFLSLSLSLAHASPLRFNLTESPFTLAISPAPEKHLNLTLLGYVPNKYAPLIVSLVRHGTPNY